MPVELLTQGAASRIPNAPSRAYLSKLSKETKRPGYFVADGGKIKINVNHPEWTQLLKKRALKSRSVGEALKPRKTHSPKPKAKPKTESKPKPKPKKKAAPKKTTTPEPSIDDPPTSEEEELAELIRMSNRAAIEEQILKNDQIRYKNEQEKLKLQKEAGNIIELTLAEFMFFGYMEKMNIELLTLKKKLRPAIENLVKAGDASGVLKRYEREFISIIKQIKRSQEKDVKKWDKESHER